MRRKNNKKVKQGRGIGEQNDRRHTVCHPILFVIITAEYLETKKGLIS